ncbi:CaiB/BaiF CoA transferase family protein [Ottowia thiooxydans]|uniref:CaiB/BaiF CoA transferase family protein n=1 Tax=Ottowia thiooxydans TaxID=219182 RepID=UPI0003FF0518|nr:CoA transferase [Ottowia thiooxydans]
MTQHLIPPPLSGVTVIDLTQIYNGPYATFLMAQAGATVIKVESPSGEHLRKRERASGVAQPFGVLNPNKKNVVLDLQASAGRETLLEMAKQADVIVYNFAPGAMDRLGLGVDTLRQANPQLIVASSTGYGSTGPYRDYPAMDLTVQAMSGVMSITGGPDTPPFKAGPALCDFFAGVHLYGAITTALYERAMTGHASNIEVSMLSSVFPSLLSSLGLHQRGDQSCKRTGNRHGGLTMCPYNVYPTSDGAIAILTVADTHWVALARVLDRVEWLEDPRFATRASRLVHMEEVDAAIEAVTRHLKKGDLFDALVESRVPSAPVRELDEVVNDPHLHETGMLSWVDHPLYGEMLAHGSPLTFADHSTPGYVPSGQLGQDTEQIVKGLLNLNDDQYHALVSRGAFGEHP